MNGVGENAGITGSKAFVLKNTFKEQNVKTIIHFLNKVSYFKLSKKKINKKEFLILIYFG